MVRRKLRMGAKTVGSLSMKIAPVSSFRVEMRPLKRLEKKESGIQVSVWREVLNLGNGERRGEDGCLLQRDPRVLWHFYPRAKPPAWGGATLDGQGLPPPPREEAALPPRSRRMEPQGFPTTHRLPPTFRWITSPGAPRPGTRSAAGVAAAMAPRRACRLAPTSGYAQTPPLPLAHWSRDSWLLRRLDRACSSHYVL